MPNSTETKSVDKTPSQEFIPIMPSLAAFVDEEYPNLPNGFTKSSVAKIMSDIYFDYSAEGILIPQVDNGAWLFWDGEDINKVRKAIKDKLGVELNGEYIYKAPALDVYKKILESLNASGGITKQRAVIVGTIITRSRGGK